MKETNVTSQYIDGSYGVQLVPSKFLSPSDGSYLVGGVLVKANFPERENDKYDFSVRGPYLTISVNGNPEFNVIPQIANKDTSGSVFSTDVGDFRWTIADSVYWEYTNDLWYALIIEPSNNNKLYRLLVTTQFPNNVISGQYKLFEAETLEEESSDTKVVKAEVKFNSGGFVLL